MAVSANVEIRWTDPVLAANRDGRGTSMKAVVYDRYGSPDVLRLQNVEQPVPTADEVLVKIHATTVTRTDCGLRSAEYFFSRFITGVRRPKRQILGMEMAGEVTAVGAAVTEFEIGDQVFGVPGSGTHAEFVCVRQSAPLAPKPANMTFAEAAAVCDGACTALACFRQANLRTEQAIVIYGATGAIGTAAVQLAKHLGAEVTAVCNTKNVELVRSLGANEVIDYLQEDFTRNGRAYDIIFDAVGKQSFRRCRGSLKPGGTFLTTDLGFMWHVPILMLWTRWIGTKRAKIGIARYSKEDVIFLKERIEMGGYRAVIDRCYPLEEVVEATRYVETGQKTGNVVLIVSDD
jgi:NADPH:quinone reductase-like Zn-dependent oxidoreductase